MLKVNHTTNSLHYRVYQKDERVLELKHTKTKLVQDSLFQNKLNVFDNLLVMEYFKYSKKVFCRDYQYTNWIIDFQRRPKRYKFINSTSHSLISSYLESQLIKQHK